MKNIEKYNESKAALNAYNAIDFKRVRFDMWLEREYEEPPKQTLLEAAESILKIVPSTPASVTRNLFRELRLAVEREKAKPVRNCEKLLSAESVSADDVEQAWQVFKRCVPNVYFDVPGLLRFIVWLFAEAK